MGAPQIILLVLACVSAGIHLANNGEPMRRNFSFMRKVAQVAILFGLLYWGGFFG